ncbi:alpha/beta hydrolase [Parasphingorhabdus sp.]
MRGYRRKFVDGRYGQMHLRIAEPDQPKHIPLICLHMFPQSGRNFEKLVEEVGTDRVVVAPDFPGYGESDPPKIPITATEYADAIWDVVENLSLVQGGGQIDVFGIHAGSKLATELTYLHPTRVRKLILTSAAILLPEEIERMRSSLSHVELDQEGSRFRRFWDMLVRNQAQDAPLELAAKNFAEMVRSGETYSWGHRAVFEYNKDFPSRLAELRHPIALLNPEDDLYEMTPRTLQHIQNGEMIDLPGWNHGFLETRAKELAQIIRNFLDDENESLVAAE